MTWAWPGRPSDSAAPRPFHQTADQAIRPATGCEAGPGLDEPRRAPYPEGPLGPGRPAGGYYNLKYYRGFDALVANTEDIAEWVVGQGWPAGKVRYIPNFAAAPPEAEPLDRMTLRNS